MRQRGSSGTDHATPPLFRESQHFRIWMFLVPVAAVTGLVWYEFYQQIIRSNPPGSQPLPDWAAWLLTIVFGLGLPAIGLLLRLVTEVRPGQMRVRVFPFRGTVIPLAGVIEAEIREYSAQREYGGWGVRSSSRAGRAYTAYGRQGVQMWLENEERILIGTQKPDELIAVLRRLGVFVR